jgi:hypothetical protein
VTNLTFIGFFAPYVASAGLKEIYGFSCCSGGFGTVNYQAGETIEIDWKQTALRSSAAPATMIVLSAKASGPFTTIAAAKTAFFGSHPKLGRTVFSATTLHVSDEKVESPVSLLHVPPGVASGFYAFIFKIVKGKNSKGGELIFTVRP